MNDLESIFGKIDVLIETIDKYRQEPLFSEELTKRQNKTVPATLTDNEILETFTNLSIQPKCKI